MNAVVIGVGNEYRRDDGVAAVVLDRLRSLASAGIALVVSDGEPSALLDAWADRELAIVVDAVRCEPAAPGTVHRSTAWPVTGPTASFGSSGGGSHALGVPDAVRLGEALGRLPRRLVVLAVEAADLGFGVGLSPEVAAVVDSVVDAVLAESGAMGPD